MAEDYRVDEIAEALRVRFGAGAVVVAQTQLDHAEPHNRPVWETVLARLSE